MTLYEYLADYFSQKLGTNYNVLYNNNDDYDWDACLIDNMIHGILRVTGGQAGKVAGTFMENKTMNIDFAIPTDMSVMSEAIQTIDDTFAGLNLTNLIYESNTVQVGYNYRSDASYLGNVNGTTYALVSISITVFISESVAFANECTVKIDGTELTGVIDVIPSTKHSFDSYVKNGSNGKVTNTLNSIGYSLTVDFVLGKENTLHIALLTNQFSNKQYAVTYTTPLYTYTSTMSVCELTVTAVLGDTLKAKLVLMEV